jgi:hypothetical protein
MTCLAASNILSLPIVGRTLVAPDGSSLTIPASATAAASRSSWVYHRLSLRRGASSGVKFELFIRFGSVQRRHFFRRSSVLCLSLFPQARVNLLADVAGWFAGFAGFAGSAFRGFSAQKVGGFQVRQLHPMLWSICLPILKPTLLEALYQAIQVDLWIREATQDFSRNRAKQGPMVDLVASAVDPLNTSSLNVNLFQEA